MIEFFKSLICGKKFTTEEFKVLTNKILDRTISELNGLIDDIDVNKDGVISYGEIYKFFKGLIKTMLEIVRND
jgi:hypothetical protein